MKRALLIIIAVIMFLPEAAFLQEMPVPGENKIIDERDTVEVVEEALPGVEIEQSEDEEIPEEEEVPEEVKKGRLLEELYVLGNEAFSRTEIEASLSLKQGRPYTEERLKKDIENLLNKYRENGYIYAVINKSEQPVREDEKNLYAVVRLEIKEGNIYRVKGVKLVGNHTYPDSFLKSMLEVNEGGVIDDDLFEESIKRVLSAYQGDGFPDAEIAPDIILDDIEGTVDIVLNIDEGKRGQIGIIEVKGNTSTQASTIIREMRVREGEYFSDEKLEEVKRRLMNMGIVQFKDMQLYDTEAEGVVKMVVEVEERKSNNFKVLLGYVPFTEQQIEEAEFNAQKEGIPLSEVKRGYVMGTVDISLGNLFGTARKFEFKFNQEDEEAYNFNLGFTEPWMFGQPIEVSFNVGEINDLKNRDSGINKYLYKKSVWDLSFLYSFSQFINGVFKYGQTNKDITFKGSTPEEEFTADRDSLTYDFTFEGLLNTVDIPWNPTRGINDKLSFLFQMSKSTNTDDGSEDGRTFYVDTTTKINADLSHFYNINENAVYMLRFIGKAAFINETSNIPIPVSNYFKLGGANTLRGFFENQFTGTWSFLVNNEIRFLTGDESYFAFFADIGAAWVDTGSELVVQYLWDRIMEGGKDATTKKPILGEAGGGIGYGLAFSQKVPVGKFNVSVAFGLGDDMSDVFRVMKIHVSFQTQL